MGKRFALTVTEADVAALPLAEIDRQIAFLKNRIENSLSASLRRGNIRHLIWLELQRERHHGIAAPYRVPVS